MAVSTVVIVFFFAALAWLIPRWRRRTPTVGHRTLYADIAALRFEKKFSTDSRRGHQGRRKIYIDLGVNWQWDVSINLYQEISKKMGLPLGRESDWKIYGFEADPHMWNYLDAVFQYLNNETDWLPHLPLPLPSKKASQRFLDYASEQGCQNSSETEAQQCLFSKIDKWAGDMRKLDYKRIDDLAEERLGSASTRGKKYTMIPRAVGDTAGRLSLEPTASALRAFSGYCIPLCAKWAMRKRSAHIVGTKYVDVISLRQWLVKSFDPSDWIVLKMDIEGAECGIMPNLISSGVLNSLVDVLYLECHPGRCGVGREKCQELDRRIREECPGVLQYKNHGHGFESEARAAYLNRVGQLVAWKRGNRAIAGWPDASNEIVVSSDEKK